MSSDLPAPARGSTGTTVIHFIRHTEVHNPQLVVYGRLPRYHLSARGREQAEITAAYLAELPLSVIYTSPLLRARQTATIIAQPHPLTPIRTLDLVTEVHTSWQGSPFKEAEAGGGYYEPPRALGDESILDVYARMDRALRRLRARHQGQTVVCVSHADPIMILKTPYLRRPLTQEGIKAPDYPSHGSVTSFIFHNPDYHVEVQYVSPVPPPPEEKTPTEDVASERASAAREEPELPFTD